MGHEHSKFSSSPEDSSSVRKGSRLARFKNRLHFRRKTTNASPSTHKLLSAGNFTGIALFALLRAEMQFKDKWIACLSLGEQTFRTKSSQQLVIFTSLHFITVYASFILLLYYFFIFILVVLILFNYCCCCCRTDKPVWNSEKKLLLEQNGPHIARVSVFETNKLSSNTLVGYCEIDLLEFLTQDSDSDIETFNLLDPSVPGKVVGNISISCSVEDPIETEKGFVRRILSIVDYNEDGMLSFSEFSDLIDAFGNQLATSKKEELFKAADKNGDGVVSMDELASLLAFQQEKEPLLNCCPVCGEVLQISDQLNSMIHLTLCFDEGTGNQVMAGGFLTDKQASYGWFFKLSEWAHVSSYDVGIRSGSSSSHILVYDRKSQRLVEEQIDKKIVLSMRAIYQSKIGLGLMDIGVKELLQNISEKQGAKMDSLESAADIPKFIESYKGQINLAEVKYPLEHFKTFNEFFIRELKPGSRPIASAEHDNIAVCGADCRLMAFKSVDDSSRFWIKGRKFSVQGLLGKEMCSSAFADGTLVIFRLAPQDYHRFHLPVSGTVEQFVNIPGCLFTVNPIAVNSKYCNVFTENKRVVSIISTVDFGKVAFVAIGATMVGSINFTKKKGDYVKKGDEFGYFSFGGSTVICVFEKDSIAIDEDLLSNSTRSLETLVTVGMRLGVSTRKLS
ncbi:phosphatidylserine decarboxylase proenzyme 2-like isoform X1 [Trifolium pratense]|uniref:phosphatidylserine decarboxylase proenzyme 2-like isoform X1 n=1 Tax=Trifolium pratense TaxID=57577 RepID=UPI001E6982F7|nr:phosphatidylserine decarboxylase proenzyme 2-like isoform X1 [Trifolium pratense]